MQGVTITNTSNNTFVFTDQEGNFSILAKTGERVAFSCPGYKTEIHVVIPELNGIRLRFAMKMMNYELKEVIIKRQYDTKYQADSAERRSIYKRALGREKGGSIFSPVTLLADKLSKKSKDLYRFQRNYETWENDRFIESRYTPDLVKSLTGLSGDTLAAFMNGYVMPYDYARSASELELKMWIRSNFKTYLIQTDSLRKIVLPAKQ